jgi:hypothetical protein
MTKKKSAKPSLKAEATAKAELVAKATYQRKHSTTEVIPADVTRARAGAWLDLISPITAWAGLKGDQLQHKRELLRIQQEAVLYKIARSAKRKLVEQNIDVVPIPTKFLVPFLERASLEDESSDLCDRWSDLLVSAATEYDPSMIRFSAILGEIGAGEVNLLNRMVREPRGTRRLNHIEDVPHVFFQNVLDRFISNEVQPQETEEELCNAILRAYEYPGTAWPFLGVGDWDFSNLSWTDKDDAIASNLVSLGILHLIESVDGSIGEFSWYGRVYAVTAFGLRFLLACDRSIARDLEVLQKAFEEAEKNRSP